jgi:hypothetical protein
MRYRTVTAAVLCCALVVAPAALAGKADTDVSVTNLTQNADGSGHYEGEVKAKGKCKKNRKITVIHLSDPPFTIGETKTDEDGFWQLNGPLPPESDKIKVVVKQTRKCKGASETYKVSSIPDDD